MRFSLKLIQHGYHQPGSLALLPNVMQKSSVAEVEGSGSRASGGCRSDVAMSEASEADRAFLCRVLHLGLRRVRQHRGVQFDTRREVASRRRGF